MNFTSRLATAFFLFAQLLTAFKIGDLVTISGLKTDKELNGSVAIIHEVNFPSSTGPRYRVYALLDDKMRSYERGQDVFEVIKRVSVKPANLETFRHNFQEGSVEAPLENAAELTIAVMKCDPESCADPAVEHQMRVIGGWVNKHHGMRGMMYAADYAGRPYTRTIESVWSGIGMFQ